MFENIINFFKKLGKNEKEGSKSKDTAKERLHLVLMQDRANISADFLALMKQEIIEVIKRYIDVDENAIDVRLTNKSNDDGTTGAPVLYANIPIVSVKDEVKKVNKENKTDKKEEIKLEDEENNNSDVNEEETDKVENEEEKKIVENKIEENEVEQVIQKAEEIVEEDKKEQI